MNVTSLHERFDTASLRKAFGKFATGVTVVAFRDDEGVAGITVNSFTSVSLEPPLLLVSVQKTSRCHDRMLDREFSVSVLSDRQHSVARSFASRDRHGAPPWNLSGKVPKVDGAISWFECEPWAHYDAGDHTLLVGEIRNFGSDEGEPLLFYGGRMLEPQSDAW